MCTRISTPSFSILQEEIRGQRSLIRTSTKSRICSGAEKSLGEGALKHRQAQSSLLRRPRKLRVPAAGTDFSSGRDKENKGRSCIGIPKAHCFPCAPPPAEEGRKVAGGRAGTELGKKSASQMPAARRQAHGKKSIVLRSTLRDVGFYRFFEKKALPFHDEGSLCLSCFRAI